MEETKINKNKLSEIVIDEEEIKFLLSEPITWTFIALAIAQGMLQKLGAEVFAGLFSRGVNLETLIKNLLKEVDRIVTLRIEESAIAEEIDKVKSIDFILRQYLNSRTKERLDLIYENSAYLVNRLERFKHKTYKEYILSVSFQLVALEEMYLTIPEEKANIIELLRKAINNVTVMNEGWRPISDARFVFKFEDTYPYPENPTPIRFFYVLEGNRKIVPNSRNEADVKQKFKGIKNSRYQSDIVDVYVVPAAEILKLWEERIKQLSEA